MTKHATAKIPISSLWAMSRQMASGHAAALARFCDKSFADLITEEGRKYCDQPEPQDSDELAERHKQAIWLSTKTATVACLESMASSNDAAAIELLEYAQDFCKRTKLDDGVSIMSSTTMIRATTLCHMREAEARQPQQVQSRK